jgi:Sugar (and other) transporter
MLLILAFLLDLNEENPAKQPLVVMFILLFALCYSPGAGCVPFTYSAEVWPNEGRGVSRLVLLSSPLFRTMLYQRMQETN